MRRALRSRPIRFWLAAGGVGTSALLVLVLGAAYRSVSTSVAGYIGQPGIDWWIAPSGTDNLLRSSAMLPAVLADSLRSLAGVVAADPVLRTYVTVKARRGDVGPRLALIGIGYVAPDGRGGPPLLVRGRAPRGRHDVAIDRAAAQRLGVTLGDTLWVSGRGAIVVGTTSGTNLLATQFIFGNLTTLAGPAGLSGKASFIAVQGAPGVRAAAVAEQIRTRFEDIAVFDRQEFVANNQREVGAGFLPLLALVGLLGLVGAAVLVGLLVHGVVEERHDDVVALLALGAETPRLAAGIMREAAAMVVIGVLLGGGAALGLGALLDRFLPVIPLSSDLRDALVVLMVFEVAGILAAVTPIVRLRRVDPMEAFRP